MSRDQCNHYAKEILAHFTFQNQIRLSLGEFTGNWENLKKSVDDWWREYKAWEARDTLADAYQQQRLTVKGTSKMDEAIQFQAADPDPDTRYKNTSFGPSLKEAGYKIVKTDASILARMDPKVFNPEGGKSKKTDLGYHDLSALLLNPSVPISLQQYKGRDGKINFAQTYCFMPLSFPLDQAVFQNINRLAKVSREQQGDFYDTVIDIRSKLTRIKLAAEQDMAIAFVRVGYKGTKPKFQYTLLGTTGISLRDEETGLVPRNSVKNQLTNHRLESALKEDIQLQVTGRKELMDWFTKELGGQQRMEEVLVPAELRSRLETLISNGKAKERLAAQFKRSPRPSDEKLRTYVESMIDRSGGKSMQSFRTTADLFRARQSAALNFQSMILGEIGRYAEVTLAYRKHANSGNFPKFAKFDKAKSEWIVGTVNNQNVWTEKSPKETFPDKPA